MKGNQWQITSALFWPTPAVLTPVAISYLKERTGKDVGRVLDVASGESLETIKQRALACGAVESYVVDARDEFANEYCMKALKANAMYEGSLPAGLRYLPSADLQDLVRAAHQFGAEIISHGCTGKGNDQVRFEVSITHRPDAEGHQPDSRPVPDPRRRDRVRQGAQAADHPDREVPVLHRPECGPRH